MISLQDQMKALESIQELDLRIDQLQKRKMALPLVLKSAEDEIGKWKAQIGQRQKVVLEVEKAALQIKAAIDLNNDRLTRASSKLESVQNAQEFNAATKEIEQLKKMNLGLEESVKKNSEDLQKTKGDISNFESKIATLKQEKDVNAEKFDLEEREVTGEIEKLNSGKQDFLQQVDKKVVALYSRVRSARAGVGIVPMVAGRCTACNMVVPPQMAIEIQKLLTVHQCPSCHRIIFYK